MNANFNTPNSQRVQMSNNVQRQAWRAVAAAKAANDAAAAAAASRVVQACWKRQPYSDADYQAVMKYAAN
jgi:hypothetical protein